MREVLAFLRVNKKWWLGPIVVVLALLALVLVLAQSSPTAPFVYTRF